MTGYCEYCFLNKVNITGPGEMKKHRDIIRLLIVLMVFCMQAYAQKAAINTIGEVKPIAGVRFETSDKALKMLYDEAERKCLENLQQFGKYNVLVEGPGYPCVWLETQPMGGEMYAKRNLRAAIANQLIFMDHQRADGRLPGRIRNENGVLECDFGWVQGFCFPGPALDMYYHMGRDKNYLKKLYDCLARFDAYLWGSRDSDGDGCLESWCVYDTGEDNSSRLDGSPLEWPYEFAPNDSLVKAYGARIQQKHIKQTMPVPIESMDFMSYSHSARAVLAQISEILGNGKSAEWTAKAKMVRDKIRSYLWDPKKSACYDRDADNKPINILQHNNIRAMYYGSFDKQMADDFISKHLLNPKEFWTPVPLPSIAANDKAFRNAEGNDWSGQPQGLTFQRIIGALENYGHYAEVGRIGEKLIAVLKQEKIFAQQYNPFTGAAGSSEDGYGPTMLAFLEYLSRMYGVHYTKDKIWWSGLNSGKDTTTYEQVVHGKAYRLETDRLQMRGYLNEKLIFTSSPNVRLVTDMDGKLLEIVGIDSVTRKVKIRFGEAGTLRSQVVKSNVRYR